MTRIKYIKRQHSTSPPKRIGTFIFKCDYALYKHQVIIISSSMSLDLQDAHFLF